MRQPDPRTIMGITKAPPVSSCTRRAAGNRVQSGPDYIRAPGTTCAARIAAAVSSSLGAPEAASTLNP